MKVNANVKKAIMYIFVRSQDHMADVHKTPPKVFRTVKTYFFEPYSCFEELCKQTHFGNKITQTKAASTSALCCIFRTNKNPYHSSHDSSAHTFSLHIRDKLCMLLLHIEKKHDANQTHQLHLWNKMRIMVTLHKVLVCQLGP